MFSDHSDLQWDYYSLSMIFSLSRSWLQGLTDVYLKGMWTVKLLVWPLVKSGVMASKNRHRLLSYRSATICKVCISTVTNFRDQSLKVSCLCSVLSARLISSKQDILIMFVWPVKIFIMSDNSNAFCEISYRDVLNYISSNRLEPKPHQAIAAQPLTISTPSPSAAVLESLPSKPPRQPTTVSHSTDFWSNITVKVLEHRSTCPDSVLLP